MEKGNKERKKRGRGRRESNKPSKATKGIQMFYRVTRAGAEIDGPDADSKTRARIRLLARKENTFLADKGAFSPCLHRERRKSGTSQRT